MATSMGIGADDVHRFTRRLKRDEEAATRRTICAGENFLNTLSRISHDHALVAHRAHDIRECIDDLKRSTGTSLRPDLRASVDRAVNAFKHDVSAHIHDEERNFFVMALKVTGEEEDIKKLIVEHRVLEFHVDNALQATRDNLPTAEVRDRLITLIELFENHSESEARFISKNRDLLSPAGFMGG